MTLYASDKRTCVQDFSGRLYSVSAYYAAKQVAVLPFLAANLLVTDLIAVGMVGMRTDPAALATLVGLSIVFYLLAQQVQSLVVILTPNQEAAFSVSIGFTAVQLLMVRCVVVCRSPRLPPGACVCVVGRISVHACCVSNDPFNSSPIKFNPPPQKKHPKQQQNNNRATMSSASRTCSSTGSRTFVGSRRATFISPRF
jgi:hypothetical protein